MKINNLIDRHFGTTSVLEDTRDVSHFFNECEYLAVLDEGLHTTGIVTLKDLNAQPNSRNLMDCDISKPRVSPDQSVYEVFQLMKETHCDFLPVYADDNFIGVIALIAITEKLAQAVTETKQYYQKAIHDLRNPIGNIQGLVNILNDSIIDKENHDLIKLCNLSCKHAMDILDDLLYVEVDESKPLNKIPTEMNGFYAQCINEQLGLCLLKGIEIETNLSKKAVIKNIDRNQIKRAVQNVISNAIKFSYPGSVIQISSIAGGGRLALKIADKGVGIPNYLQSTIFEKFTPAQRVGTNGEPSTGLGLCFTKQCMEQHDGLISFKSKEGKGTTFLITL